MDDCKFYISGIVCGLSYSYSDRVFSIRAPTALFDINILTPCLSGLSTSLSD